MATRLQDKKADLLERVVDRLHDQLAEGQAERAEAFLRHYYRAVPPIDLLERDPLDLYGAALSHLRLGEHRTPGQALVRVYTPQVEQHGWQSTHTVVEVITDDMPFLVDSASMALNRLGLLIHITIHPVMPVKRAPDGALTAVLESPAGDGGDVRFESYMHFEVDRQSDPERIEAIRSDLERVLADVRAGVEDWRTMLGKVEDAIADLRRGAKALEPTELEEAVAFLRWIADNHFTFLGYGCYDLVRDEGGDQLRRVEDSALGLLRRQEGYRRVVAVGGSEGAVVANLLAARGGLVDASIAFNGGGRWFLEDVLHGIATGDAPASEKAQSIEGLRGFARYVSETPSSDLVASNHGHERWRQALALDQRALLEQVRTPLLVIQAGADTSVSPDSVARMVDALRRAGRGNIEYRAYPGLDHGLREPDGTPRMGDVALADPADEPAYVPALEAIGYVLVIREPSWHQHRCLQRAAPRVNLHVFGPDCPENIRHRMFRDWLRDHDDDRDRYAQAKHAAARGVDQVADYNLRKQAVIRDIYERMFRAAGFI